MEIIKGFFNLFEGLDYQYIFMVFSPYLCWMLYKRQNRQITRMVITFTLCLYTVILIKGCLRIPSAFNSKTYSFPSGHVYAIMAFCGSFFFETIKSRKVAFWIMMFSGMFECLRTVIGGFHTPRDAFSAYILCTIQFLVIYLYVYKKFDVRKLLLFCFIGNFVILGLLHFICHDYMVYKSLEMTKWAILCLVFWLFETYKWDAKLYNKFKNKKNK